MLSADLLAKSIIEAAGEIQKRVVDMTTCNVPEYIANELQELDSKLWNWLDAFDDEKDFSA